MFRYKTSIGRSRYTRILLTRKTEAKAACKVNIITALQSGHVPIRPSWGLEGSA